MNITAKLPLFIAPPLAGLAAALLTGRLLPRWGFMVAVSLAIFWSLKWISLLSAFPQGPRPSLAQRAAYLGLWVGMDAPEFFRRELARPPRRAEFAQALGKLAAGIALVALSACWVGSTDSLAAGYAGLAGFGLVFHFGGFHVLSIFWRARGFNAEPIMRAPSLSRSLSEFWGRRWNVAFRRLAHDFVYRPFARRIGSRGASFAAFLASGLVHDVAISLPAGGGFGLPTLYFLVQWLGLEIERSRTGRRLGLGAGMTGRVFAAAVLAAPLPLLFHAAFIHQVVIPFLRALRAL